MGHRELSTQSLHCEEGEGGIGEENKRNTRWLQGKRKVKEGFSQVKTSSIDILKVLPFPEANCANGLIQWCSLSLGTSTLSSHFIHCRTSVKQSFDAYSWPLWSFHYRLRASYQRHLLCCILHLLPLRSHLGTSSPQD